jgi:hypothetical protein
MFLSKYEHLIFFPKFFHINKLILPSFIYFAFHIIQNFFGLLIQLYTSLLE